MYRRNWLLSAINFLLDIVDFGQRPEPRSSKHEFQIEQFQGWKGVENEQAGIVYIASV